MNARILISGAFGFTGKHFVELARANGFQTTALKSNLLDPKSIAQELENNAFDYVVHLAAISAVTHDDQLALYEANVFGTQNLLQGLTRLRKKPRKVLLASSANIYGNAEHSPIAETASPSPINHYAMSKLAMEHMSQQFANELPLIVTRPFNYTGAGHDDRFVIPKIIAHFQRKSRVIELGNTAVLREYNDVRSVSKAYLDLLEKGVTGETYNICSGRVHSLDEVLADLKQLSGHHIEVKANPLFVRKNEVRELCGDNTKLEACIGNQFTHTLRDTLQWMLNG